jgi:RHS repeat-associated protein
MSHSHSISKANLQRLGLLLLVFLFLLIDPGLFPGEAKLSSGYGNVATVACASAGTSTDMPNGRAPVHPHGTLVKVSGNGTVYLIEGGRKRAISSQAVLSNLYPNGGFTNNEVITISQDELNRYSPGNDINGMLSGNGRSQPDGRLIQASGGAEISIVTNNGERRPFGSGAKFESLGYQFCNVILISAADYNSYQPVGMVVGEFPSLSTPANGSTGQSQTPTFSWSTVAGVESYTIAVATSQAALPTDPGAFNCSGCVIFAGTSSTSFSPMTGVLSPNTQYFWRVNAINFPDYGVWSATRSFTTAAPTDAMQLVSKTPPDGQVFATNSSFSATWRLRNTGDTTWNSGYAAVWIQTPVDGHESYNLTSPLRVGSAVPTAAPGTEVDLTVTMITPTEPGAYYMYWQLQNGNGGFFGARFYVQIVVTQAGDESFGSDGEDFGSGDSPGSNVGMNDDSLNTATGNFNYRVTDLTIPGRGMDFVFGRSYNAKDSTGSPMGPGWSHSFNVYLSLLPGGDNVSFHYGDGKILIYGRTSGNAFKPLSKGYFDALTRNADGSWMLLKPDQREFHFNNQGRLSHIRDRNGNQITLFYGADNNIARIVDTVGREIFFTYTSSLLTGISDPAGRRLSFQYAGNKLSVFRDAKNNPNNYSYDGAGRLSEIFDGRGIRVMSNAYDAQGRLVNQTNGRNIQWTIIYNDLAGTTSVTDPNQKQIVYSYDSGHKLVGFTNRLSQQNRVKIDYDAGNNRSGVNDPNSLTNVYSYLYDNRNGYVTRSTDPDTKTRNFVYDNRNNPSQVTDELNHTTFMGYDARGNMTTLTDALSHATSVNYDAFGQPTSITDPNLNTVLLNYDSQGNLLRVEDAEHNVTLYGYDGVGRRTSLTDARNKVTRFTYDENDNLTSVQRPIGTTTYGYDQADNLTSITDPASGLTTFEYDANHNLVVERDATRVFSVQHTFDSLDRLVSTRDKRGNTTTFEYDPEGRLLSDTDPMLNKTSYTYDGNGNRLSSTDANNQTTTYTYDKLNRLKTVQDSLGNTILKEYDAAGQLSAETDARGNTTRFTYDEVGNLRRVDDAEAGVSQYTYDKNRNLRTQTDPNNHTSTLNYDKANRLIFSLDPLGNRYDYEYDGIGNRISQTDAKRQTTRFTYNDNNRLASIAYPDSTGAQFTYDVNGNLKQVFDARGATTYVYDALSRITSYTDVYGKTLGYQYDPNGNITTLTYPDGKQVQYTYDQNNRMTSLTDWGGMTVSYNYNSADLLTKIIPPTNSDIGSTNYTYDPAGRLIGMTTFHTRGSDDTYAYTLDRNGNRISATVQESLQNRIAATTQSYGYDAANRIQHAGTTTFAFDANGNMTGKTDGGVTTTYTYDFNDRLIGDGVNTFFYNAQGVRVAKSRQNSVTRYVVDVNRELSQALCETDGGGGITSYYVYGQGLVYKVLPDGAHYYYQFDPNGSTISMVTYGGFSVNRYAYDPYGKVTNSAEVFPNTNATFPNSFKFGGRFGLMDDGNGLVYVRARYYSPDLGRFLTKDPLTGDLKDGQTLNRYIYALDNPINLIDADGLWSINPLKVVLERAKDAAAKAIGNKVVSAAKNQLTKYVNTHGFSRAGKVAFSTYNKLGTPLARGVAQNAVGTGMAVVQRAIQDTKNPNLTGLEKAARISLTISDTAVAGIAGKAGGPWVGAVAAERADASFDTRYSLLKKGVDNLFDKYGTTVDWTEYRKNEALQVGLRQQQRAIKQGRAPAFQVMPRGPAATPIMPRGPKPAPISPRGPAKK